MTIPQTVVRTLGSIQIGLGVLFWTYNALNLIPLHMLVGLVVVLAPWVLAGLGLRAGVHPGLANAASPGASLSSPRYWSRPAHFTHLARACHCRC
jgi:hypothetical protein